MTEQECETVLAMIDGHWTMRMNEATQELWRACLRPLEAEAATKAVARLAQTHPMPPRISELQAVYVDYAPALPPPTTCATCGGDRLVVVGSRPWQGASYPEYAPCPDCNAAADVSFTRADGSRFEGMDPATVRERMEARPRQRAATTEENRQAAEAALASMNASTESP